MGEAISALRRQLNILARNTHNPLSPGSPSAAAPDAFTDPLPRVHPAATHYRALWPLLWPLLCFGTEANRLSTGSLPVT